MKDSPKNPPRNPRRILSVPAGNWLQAGGILVGCVLLWLSSMPLHTALRVLAMIAGYLLIYFSSHSLIHFLAGTAVGIKFTHYSIGGTSHPATFPPLIRPIFENTPFFAVHTDRDSLHSAGRWARALMFGSGIIATAIFSTVASFYTFRAEVPGGTALLIFNAIWQVSSLIAESGGHGDLGKAASALRK